MAKLEFEDFLISVTAADYQITEKQRALLNEHFQLFQSLCGNADPASPEGVKIYYKTMREVPGVEEVYELLEALTDYNIETLKRGIKL